MQMCAHSNSCNRTGEHIHQYTWIHIKRSSAHLDAHDHCVYQDYPVLMWPVIERKMCICKITHCSIVCSNIWICDMGILSHWIMLTAHKAGPAENHAIIIWCPLSYNNKTKWTIKRSAIPTGCGLTSVSHNMIGWCLHSHCKSLEKVSFTKNSHMTYDLITGNKCPDESWPLVFSAYLNWSVWVILNWLKSVLFIFYPTAIFLCYDSTVCS